MSVAQLADVQGGSDKRGITLAKAGVCDLRLPVPFTDADRIVYPTECTVRAWTAVDAAARGAHMSRLVAAVGTWRSGLSGAALPAWLSALAAKQGSSAVGCELEFNLFVERTAPVTGSASWLDFAVWLDARWENGQYQLRAKVTVPVTMLCPCSKEISSYGAHSQRAWLNVAFDASDGELPCLSEIARRIEAHASAQLYALLKRDDEKAVTEQAYDNPRFAEDAARELAAEMRNWQPDSNWKVGVLNFESIHNHNVFVEVDAALSGAP